MPNLGAVELGGTKTLVASGRGVADLHEPFRIETSDPATTLDLVCDRLLPADVEAVGVACFGPLELRSERGAFGHIVRTPKPGWSLTDVAGALRGRLGLPLSIDTDVNGAALGEWKWGATSGLESSAYVTVGTGIGGGVLVSGRPLHGAPHPEVGHTVVLPHPEDDHPGSCPYHGRCLEGMASGPAIAARFGRTAEDLPEDLREEALDLVTYYLAQGLRNLVYGVAPERIVVGGGVSKLPGFHQQLGRRLLTELAGYPGVDDHAAADFVVAPGLGDLSGLAGAMVLAGQAAR